MGRLIDADLFKEDMTNEFPEYYEEVLDAQPTIDAEPVRHGKWKDIRYNIGTCSECGDRYGSVDVMNYCPNCGARMDEEL